MNPPISQLLTLALLGSALAAQGSSLVSPLGLDSVEGNSQNTFPFNSSFRYMQIHGDLRQKVMVIKGMSFRRDGKTATSGAARTLDIEIRMGASDYAKASANYTNNFSAAPTQVFKRAKVNFPAWPSVVSTPSPFNAVVPFNNGTYIFTGTTDLAWEWVTHSTTSTGYYLADAVSLSDSESGPYTRLGVGCIATGQTRTMDTLAYFTSYRSSNRLRYYASTRFATASALGAILIGVKNPNLAFPVCGPKRLYTDALITLPKTATASGLFNTGTQVFLPFSASYVGLKAYTQCYTADAKLGPLPVAVSNGVESVVPALAPLGSKICRIYARGATTPPAGRLALQNGLVVRFDQ